MRRTIHRNQLQILISQVLRMVGGTGIDMTNEQYIADVVKEWSNTKDRLQVAIDCFADVKERCVGTIWDVTRKTRETDKEQHDTMAKTTNGKPVAEEKQEGKGEVIGRDGFLTCGITQPNIVPVRYASPDSVPRPANHPTAAKKTSRKTQKQ